MNAIHQQYNILKSIYTDAVVLLKVGDQYLTFKEDAGLLGPYLNTCFSVYSKDGEGRRFVAFPEYYLDRYVGHLMRSGRKVAVCVDWEEEQKKSSAKKPKRLPRQKR